MDPNELLERLGPLTQEEKTRLLWKMTFGHEVLPWTEGQEMAVLLGTLTCPMGDIIAVDRGEIEPPPGGEDDFTPLAHYAYLSKVAGMLTDEKGVVIEDGEEEDVGKGLAREVGNWSLLAVRT